MKYLRKAVLWINSISGIISGLGIFVMVGIIISIVFSRPLKIQLVGAYGYEVYILFGVVMVSFALILTSISGQDIMVTVLFDRFPPRLKKTMLIISRFLTLAFWSFICWESVRYAKLQADIGEYTAVGNFPIFPFRYLFALAVVIMCFLSFLRIIDSFLSDEQSLFGMENKIDL